MSRDFDAMQDALRAIQLHQQHLSPSNQLLRAIDEANLHQRLLSPTMQIQEMMDRGHPHFSLTGVTDPLLRHGLQHDILADVYAKLSVTNTIADLVKQHASGLSSAFSKIEEQQLSFANMLKPHLGFTGELPLSIASMVGASSLWKSSVDAVMNRFNEIGLVGSRDDLVDRLLAPSRAYADFVEEAMSRFNDGMQPSTLVGANAALRMIESQYTAISSSLTMLPPPLDHVAPFDERLLNAPLAQFDAALQLDWDNEEQDTPEERIIVLPATVCAEDARAMVSLVCRSNEITASAGKGEFFKPTTRFVEACTDISWIVACDKKTFGDLIDCLYFIFYEGAGKDNLRFLDKHGGPLKPDEADFIWCLKHLRNKYSRHDPDHGKPADIAKSWADLQKKWESLGLNSAPYKSEDFLAAQRALVRMAKEFMESLLSQLTGRVVN